MPRAGTANAVLQVADSLGIETLISLVVAPVGTITTSLAAVAEVTVEGPRILTQRRAVARADQCYAHSDRATFWV
ncbi:MAG: hypothetical protein FJ147_05310 [Deltaproteobacteria bacterium]|nr:hypothetical protein [Deltaproteobacteria bacterium]